MRSIILGVVGRNPDVRKRRSNDANDFDTCNAPSESKSLPRRLWITIGNEEEVQVRAHVSSGDQNQSEKHTRRTSLTPWSGTSCARVCVWVGVQLRFAVDFVVDLRTNFYTTREVFYNLRYLPSRGPPFRRECAPRAFVCLFRSNATTPKAIRPPVDIYFLCRYWNGREQTLAHVHVASSSAVVWLASACACAWSANVCTSSRSPRGAFHLPGGFSNRPIPSRLWMKMMISLNGSRSTRAALGPLRN